MDIQWPLAIFSTLAGCGGALLAMVGVSELLKIGEKARCNAAIASIVLLVVGGCASVFHLAQKANIMAAAANVFSFSGISVELMLLGVNVLLALGYVVALKRGASISKALAIIGIVTGLAMAFAVGNGYIMEARHNWNTIALPISYLGSGIACGTIAFAALSAACGCEQGDIAKAAKIAVGGAAVGLLTSVAYAAATGFVLDAMWFWGIAVLLGCAIAGALAFAGLKRPSLLYGATACALVGGLGLRAAMFLAGTGFIDAFALAASRSLLGL